MMRTMRLTCLVLERTACIRGLCDDVNPAD